MKALKMIIVNEKGMMAIAEFLKNNHKRGAEISKIFNCINAWANDVESNANSGKGAFLVILPHESMSGQQVRLDFTFDLLSELNPEKLT